MEPDAPGAPGAPAGETRPVIVALVPDLMDRSKVITATSVKVGFVPSAQALAERVASGDAVDLVLVDLGRRGVLDVLPEVASAARVIAFGSHVDTEVLAAARMAGCDQVLARSVFFSRLSELLPG